jgi:hypothetical protein
MGSMTRERAGALKDVIDEDYREEGPRALYISNIDMSY